MQHGKLLQLIQEFSSQFLPHISLLIEFQWDFYIWKPGSEISDIFAWSKIFNFQEEKKIPNIELHIYFVPVCHF